MKNTTKGNYAGVKRLVGRKYNVVTKDKLKKMMEVRFQSRSEAKIRWAVKAYNDWRDAKLDEEDCPVEILRSDLRDTFTLNKDDFEFALCMFIVEVKKSNEDADYPGRTLYQMACAIQSFLKKKSLIGR